METKQPGGISLAHSPRKTLSLLCPPTATLVGPLLAAACGGREEGREEGREGGTPRQSVIRLSNLKRRYEPRGPGSSRKSIERSDTSLDNASRRSTGVGTGARQLAGS